MFATCRSTVCTLNVSTRAISLLLAPCATSPRMSHSRAESEPGEVARAVLARARCVASTDSFAARARSPGPVATLNAYRGISRSICAGRGCTRSPRMGEAAEVVVQGGDLGMAGAEDLDQDVQGAAVERFGQSAHGQRVSRLA
jgi:hypothetical protein